MSLHCLLLEPGRAGRIAGGVDVVAWCHAGGPRAREAAAENLANARLEPWRQGAAS